MKKMLTMVAGAAIVACAAMGGANAQGNATGPFADVPTDHWAYGSVEKLRDAKILVGYPDGTFGGRRAMTRYEFATAIARLLDKIPAPVDTSKFVTKADLNGLGRGNAASPFAPVDLTPYAKVKDVDGLRGELGRRLVADESNIAALRSLVGEFAPELKKLGVDVAAANARLDALDKRVSALEEEVSRVKITGEVNEVLRSDASSTTNLTPDKNGRKIGTQGNESIFANPEVYQDILLNIVGRVSDNTKAYITLDAGNYIPWLSSGETSGEKPANQIGIYEAYVTTPLSGDNSLLTLGQFGTQFTPFTLKAINPDVYVSNPQTSTGDVIADGAKADFNLAGAQVTAFAGNADQGAYAISANHTATRDAGFLPGSFGLGGSTWTQDTVKNISGLRATYGKADSWNVGVTGVLGDTDAGNVNTFLVWGADGAIVLPANLTAFGEVSVDSTGSASTIGNVDSTSGNEAWNVGLGYNAGALNIKAGYKDIYTNYAAPGYWGSLGSWTNPTNVAGVDLAESYTFSPSLNLVLEENIYQGQYTDVAGTNPLGKNDDLTRFNAALKYAVNPSTAVDLGYELVDYNLKSGANAADGVANGKPSQYFVTLGIGHSVNSNTTFKLIYQYAGFNDNNTGFGRNVDGVASGNTNGNIIVGQATVKF